MVGCGCGSPSSFSFLWEFFGFDITGPANRTSSCSWTPVARSSSGNWGWSAVSSCNRSSIPWRGPALRGPAAADAGRLQEAIVARCFSLLPLHPLVDPRRPLTSSLQPTPRGGSSVWMSIIVHSAQSVFVTSSSSPLVLA